MPVSSQNGNSVFQLENKALIKIFMDHTIFVNDAQIGQTQLTVAKQSSTQNNYNQFFSVYQQLDLKH